VLGLELELGLGTWCSVKVTSISQAVMAKNWLSLALSKLSSYKASAIMSGLGLGLGFTRSGLGQDSVGSCYLLSNQPIHDPNLNSNLNHNSKFHYYVFIFSSMPHVFSFSIHYTFIFQ
jgi:hypothetical protein